MTEYPTFGIPFIDGELCSPLLVVVQQQRGSGQWVHGSVLDDLRPSCAEHGATTKRLRLNRLKHDQNNAGKPDNLIDLIDASSSI